MKQLTILEFQAALRAQGVKSHLDFAFRCPMCGTIQSARDLIAAGAGADIDAVEGYLAFSCVGRWKGAAAPRRVPDGNPCDWTLGGLFTLHKLEVVTEDGKTHPRFELTSPEEAQAHALTHALPAAASVV